MAQVSFYAGKDGSFQEIISGSGLGFFGETFGSSIQVGQYQDRTFITSPNGTVMGPEANNCKFDSNSTSGVVWNADVQTTLRQIPNTSGTLNIRFVHDSHVRTQNVELRVFDRVNKDNDPVGVTAQVAELVHPWGDGLENASDPLGSGQQNWSGVHGSGVVLPMAASPGLSGLSPNGPTTSGTQHDWYVAFSASPDSIGSKTDFGLFFSLEYL